MALYMKTNNLFNKSQILLKADFAHCTDYSISEDKNILIATGKPGDGASDFSYATGWVEPTAYSTRDSSGGVPVKIGDVITVSADFTLIEQGPRTPQVRCYFYCQDNTYHGYTSANQRNISETKTRLSWTFNITKVEERYFPVFPINSNRVQIENIMISKNGKTVYEPFGGIKVKPVIRSKLSADYQPVEYIESTGTQLIDTEFYPTAKTKFCAEILFDNSNGVIDYGSAGFMGLTSDFSMNFGGGAGQEKQIFIWLNTYGGDQTKITSINYYYINEKTYYELDAKNSTYVIGTKNGKVNTTKTTDSKHPIRLFGYMNTSEVIKPFNYYPMRLYTCKFYDDDKLMRNFVPCYSKINGAIGLYDLVEGKFYGNLGTGVFAKGVDTSVVTETINGELKKYRVARGIPNPNNLYDKSAAFINATRPTADFGNCTDIYWSEDKNIIIATGKREDTSTSSGDHSWARGWVCPTSYAVQSVTDGNYGVYAVAGEKLTVSADVTLIEQGPFKPTVQVYVYHEGNGGPTAVNRKEISKVTKRYSWTLNITRAEGRYYPVFCINGNRVRIENIYMNKGDTAEPFYSGIETI